MNESSDATPAREEPRDCTYCPEPGADCCVRLAGTSSASPIPVFAHESCAKKRGVSPLYRLTGLGVGPDAAEVAAS